ncbi:hypothetical protein RUM44_002555 [Polyplax serrata]|uniref:Uncharacterized protein n=1 Tax=Polyplax serrata TaxID=468196 RepID=A0ABR1AF43_POLSC
MSRGVPGRLDGQFGPFRVSPGRRSEEKETGRRTFCLNHSPYEWLPRHLTIGKGQDTKREESDEFETSHDGDLPVESAETVRSARLRPRKRYVPEVGTHAEFDYAKEKGKGDLKLTVHSVPDKNLIIQVHLHGPVKNGIREDDDDEGLRLTLPTFTPQLHSFTIVSVAEMNTKTENNRASPFVLTRWREGLERDRVEEDGIISLTALSTTMTTSPGD